MIVVIPTNRNINLEYLSALIDEGVRFIIVDDTEGNIEINHPQFDVYNWGHRRKMLGSLEKGYPKRNGASRDFGFYVAWKNSDPGEIVVALDDDCKIYHEDFKQQVESALSPASRPTLSCDGDHLNILDIYKDMPDNLFPRGFPYSERIGYSGITVGAEAETNPLFCLGLWKGIFDVNGIDKIAGPEYTHPEAETRVTGIIDTNKLVSVCSMNMQFRRDVIPAVYQLPMHVEIMPGWVVDRYGDIWGGFILKKLMDIKGDDMVVGEPMIRHLKEGDYKRNIWQEHICHLINDEFICVLNKACENLESASYLEMMKALTEEFKRATSEASSLFRPYLVHLCNSLDAWNASLDEDFGW